MVTRSTIVAHVKARPHAMVSVRWLTQTHVSANGFFVLICGVSHNKTSERYEPGMLLYASHSVFISIVAAIHGIKVRDTLSCSLKHRPAEKCAKF
jgi:hypothetical protein